MNEYLIGAGAVLTAGPAASIAGASLHAQTDPGLAPQITAAVVDFEAGRTAELSRILIVAAGWTAARFDAEIVRPLLSRGECTVADVFAELARGTGAAVIHLFARWSPDEALSLELQRRGVAIVAHPLETIHQAALVSGTRLSRWRSPFRAA